jgi:hypothetical protein
MGFDHSFVEFLTHAAIGAMAVLLVIALVGIGIPRRSTVATRRSCR